MVLLFSLFWCRAHLAQCHNCGSSLNDQASDSAAGGGRADDIAPAPPLTIPDMIDMGVDKQAMVEDWLNPDNAAITTATTTSTAPLVQFQQDSLAIQKFSKVWRCVCIFGCYDDSFLRLFR